MYVHTGRYGRRQAALTANPAVPYIPAMADKNSRFELRTSTEFLQAIDDWRRQQPEIPSRADAIRRLVELGIEAEKSRAKKAGLKR
jgi:hypothetical protein